MLLAGVPDRFNYSPGYSKLPFWEELEWLCRYRQTINLRREWSWAKLVYKAGTHAVIPAKGVDTDATKSLFDQALAATDAVGGSLMPWLEWDRDKEPKSLSDAFQHDLPALMVAWYRYFDPENLDSYVESQKEASGDA